MRIFCTGTSGYIGGSIAAALAAAKRAAAEQRVPGRTEAIEYETADGKWHTETAEGSDRPETDVEDKP